MYNIDLTRTDLTLDLDLGRTTKICKKVKQRGSTQARRHFAVIIKARDDNLSWNLSSCPEIPGFCAVAVSEGADSFVCVVL